MWARLDREEGGESRGETRRVSERLIARERKGNVDLGRKRRREEVIQSEGGDEIGSLVEERSGVDEEVHHVNRLQVPFLVAEADDGVQELPWSKD